MLKYFYMCLLVLVTGVFFLQACERAGGRNEKERGKAVPVRAYTVRLGDVDETESYPATVVPVSEIALRPRLEGIVSHVYVREGQVVEQGEPLYGIDRPYHKRAYQEAEERLESAREKQALARQELSGYEQKREEEAGTDQQAVLARSELESATEEVGEALEQMEEVSQDLEHSLIRAPFSGTIGVSGIGVGSKVTPGQAVNMLLSTQISAVDMVMQEGKIARLERLLDRRPEDSVFMLRFITGQPYPYPGMIATIDQSVNRPAGTIIVRLVFPDPDRQLIPGMNVRVNVFYGDLKGQLVVPKKAVVSDNSDFYVYVIQGGAVERRQVILGARTSDLVVVRQGLEEGERIVVEPKMGLEDGSEVVITALPKGSAEKRGNERL